MDQGIAPAPNPPYSAMGTPAIVDAAFRFLEWLKTYEYSSSPDGANRRELDNATDLVRLAALEVLRNYLRGEMSYVATADVADAVV